MDINKIIGWYYNPPRLNDIAGWNEIHLAIGTPDGSDATMRAWAMQTMSNAILEHATRNNVAPTATLAQYEPQSQPAQPVGQSPASDPGADLEAMRKDLAWVVRELLDFGGPSVFNERLAKDMAKKWSLQ